MALTEGKLHLMTTTIFILPLFQIGNAGSDCSTFSDTCDAPPICVVGAGVTGLVIANRLQDEGKTVVVFEKSLDHIGGKLDTEEAWEGIWEKGPILFSKGEKGISKYLNKYGLKTTDWHGDNIALFNPINPTVSVIPQEQIAKWRLEWSTLGLNYIRIWKTYPDWLFEARGFERVILLKVEHPDLFLSTQEWLKYHNLEGLTFPFGIIFTCEGYGHLMDLPALYMLRLLTPPVLTDLLNLMTANKDTPTGIRTFQNGFKDLASHLAEPLQVYKGYRLFRLYRSQYNKTGQVGAMFFVGVGDARHSVTCSKVVLAFPPLLHKVGRIMNDLSLDEKILLSAVKVNKYFSSGQLLAPEGNKFVYLATVNDRWLEGDGRPIALVRSGKGHNKDAYTIYSWLYGRYDTGPSKDDLSLVDDLLRLFLRDFTNSTPTVSFTEGYEYFPHVSMGDIGNDFFGRLATLQGKNGIYYATTVTSFESVSTAIENAEAVADLILHS